MCSFTQWLLTNTSVFHFFSSHRLMNALMRHWRDLLHQPGPLLFFLPISALPPQTSFPHPSVECAHEYRHWTQTPANCFCHQSVSFLFSLPQLLMLPAWHAAGRAQRRRKLHWWKVRALFFPFVCLFASSAFPRRPALPIFLLPRDSFSFPVFPRVMSADAIREGYANFWHWEADSGLDCATAWTQKNVSFQWQKGSLVSRSLPASSEHEG